ncbi:MAG: hypothetical protein ACK5L3_15770 [Oscillospiraceae bacterium]
MPAGYTAERIEGRKCAGKKNMWLAGKKLRGTCKSERRLFWLQQCFLFRARRPWRRIFCHVLNQPRKSIGAGRDSSCKKNAFENMEKKQGRHFENGTMEDGICLYNKAGFGLAINGGYAFYNIFTFKYIFAKQIQRRAPEYTFQRACLWGAKAKKRETKNKNI